MNESNISNSFKTDDDNTQFQVIIDQNSSTSFDISRLDIADEVNVFANRVKSYFDKIQRIKSTYENAEIKTENEGDCVKLCGDILQEHIKSLDQLNVCLKERDNFSDKFEEANYKRKDLERCLWFEKESKADLKKKYEDDEQQNQEDNLKKEKLINVLQAKLKKIESEKKQLYEAKQDLLAQYQTDLAKLDKERSQLQLINKKLFSDKELDEIQSLNNKNNVINLTHELCALFNLASTYRRKATFFGKQFTDTFDLVFGRLKFNSMSNITFLDMTSINEETTGFNSSVLNLKDITCEELNNFNIILKEKLMQNEDETFINNSKIVLSGNFEKGFNNRLFGNETFKLASLATNEDNSTFIPTAFYEIISKEILDELINEETKLLFIKSLLDYRKTNSILQSSMCKNQIQFMFKADSSILEESFQEEIHNRFEESFTENLAKHCSNGNITSSRPELLKNILDNVDNSSNKQELSRNYSIKIDSKIDSMIDSRLDSTVNETDLTDNKDTRTTIQKTNIKKVVRKLNSSISDSSTDITIKNDTATNTNAEYDLTETTFKQQQNSEIQSMVKSKQWMNSTATTTTTTVTNSKLSSRSTSRSNSSSSNSSETTSTTELIVTLNKDLMNSRSDGESIDESSSYGYSNDSDINSMQLTHVNNLSSVFEQLSGNQKLNSTTVRLGGDEKDSNDEIKLIYPNLNRNNLNSTVSSDMRLSDDDEYELKIEEEDEAEETKVKFNDSKKEKNSLIINTIMSNDELSDINFKNFYTTIRQESNHSITNMDLTSSSKSTKSSSNQGISFSTLIDKYDDEYVLKENAANCSLHNSNSKCRFRRRFVLIFN